MLKKLIIVFVLFSVAVSAQKNNVSPYSFFGVGDKTSMNTVEQMSMGGVGVALNDKYHLSIVNPASSASLLFTNYTIALENKNLSVEDEFSSQNGAATYLSYLAVALPLGEKMGFSFGLMPASTVGYSLVSSVYNTEDELTEATFYNGHGGTNRVFVSFGYKLFEGFNLGLQGNYIFGNIENDIVNLESGASLASKYETTSVLSGFSLNAGFTYENKINEKLKLSLGGAFEFENEIDTDDNEYLYSVLSTSFESPRDTVLSTSSKGIIKAPLKSTLEVGLGQDDKWYAAVNYSFQKAITIEGNGFSNFSRIAYDDYSKLAIGGFYTPKATSLTSYWDRVTYRAGVKFEKTGLLVNNVSLGSDYEAIDDFGISFGVGLPINKELSNINLGFEFGKRGTTNNGLVQENYINFRLSLSLNDKWFKKIQIL